MSNARELSDVVSTNPSTDLNVDDGTLVVDESTNRVGIGTTTPGEKLEIVGNLKISDGATISTNTTSAAITLAANGDISTKNIIVPDGGTVGSATTTNALTIASNGDVTGIADINAVDFNATSDMTLKENIRPLDSVIDLIDEIKTYKFNWKESKGGKESIGVLAQELLHILPTAVGKNNSNEKEHMTVNYNHLTSVLIKAVQELSEQVRELKTKVNADNSN
tara:strand:- start:560 stop:1225 length:666 start_codon:yes stop_codon:yes gene_type:complete